MDNIRTGGTVNLWFWNSRYLCEASDTSFLRWLTAYGKYIHVLYIPVALKSSRLIFALQRSETGSSCLEFAISPILLYSHLCVTQFAQFWIRLPIRWAKRAKIKRGWNFPSIKHSIMKSIVSCYICICHEWVRLINSILAIICARVSFFVISQNPSS